MFRRGAQAVGESRDSTAALGQALGKRRRRPFVLELQDEPRRSGFIVVTGREEASTSDSAKRPARPDRL